MGVGAVRNTTNGRTLILASRDLTALLNRHRAQLRLNAHANRALQADWNTLGPDVFEFVVLDILVPKDTPDYDPTEDLRTWKSSGWRNSVHLSLLGTIARRHEGPSTQRLHLGRA
jgi:hypothetical protein